MSEKEIYRETNVTIESPLLDDEVQEAMKDSIAEAKEAAQECYGNAE